MKIPLILTTILIITFSSYGQQLTTDETISYIKTQVKKYFLETDAQIPTRDKDDSISISISENGYVNIKTWIFYMGNPNWNSQEDPNTKYKSLYEDFTFDYRKIRVDIIDRNEIAFYCSNCIQENKGFTRSVYSMSRLGLKLDMQGIEKVKNAFDYLLEILRLDERYNKKDNDPFASDNYEKKVFIDKKIDPTKQNINLKQSGNLFVISASLCGILQDMIFDSGASDVTISTSTEKKLIEKGLISSVSYLTPSLYKLADGSIVKAKRLKLPSIKVGAFTVKDVVCCVNPSSDVQLLGKSFLNRFSKWTINNNNSTLTLEE